MFNRKMIPAFRLYSVIIVAVLGWWYLAFHSPSGSEELEILDQMIPIAAHSQHVTSNLSSLNRKVLHDALTGDFSLIPKLISDWDLDAQIMEVQGRANVRRLTREDYLRAQLLGRQLRNCSAKELQALKEANRARVVYDDDSKPFLLNNQIKRFFPQTYVSTSFLLALLDPKQIVAIPQGLRKQTQLFPTELTNQIPFDIDHYNSEKLYLVHPDIAFVAHYSHPATLQALIEQDVKLFNLKCVNTLSDITNAFLRVGHLIDRPLEAELMKIFIEAAMYAIDNRFLDLDVDFSNFQHSPKILFLNHHSNFNIPTKRSLTGQLLQRVGIQDPIIRKFPNQQHEWLIPVDQEQIINLDPEGLIVATVNVNASRKQIMTDPALQRVNAVQNNRLFFVDEIVQQYPSQYIVLAYYDLLNAVSSVIHP